jgi:phosphatidylglycerol---prolipoprotein diacylglyceryl transferase
MTILNYILWSTSPEIFSIGSFSLRWYGVFFALGFLITQQVLYYIYRKEGKPESDVDTLTIYMVVATILGARLGHVIFYDPEIIWTDPLGIILPFEFSPFKFTGLQGLASHGAAIGILFSLWLYSRKKKPGQNYLQVVDRIVILVAFAGALIRLGNYYNAEIIGKPTDKPWGVVFTGKLNESLHSKNIDTDDIIESVGYVKNDTTSLADSPVGRKPLLIYIFFKPGTTQVQIENLVNRKLRYIISDNLREYFDDVSSSLFYQIAKEENGNFAARIRTVGIARHPAQLYESISCVFLCILLFLIWNKYKENLPPGRLLGIFLIICFGLRFCYEFLKENQEAFEGDLPLNMGQILSIPLVLAGVVILYLSFRENKQDQVSGNS